MRSSTEMLIKFMRIMLGNNDTVPPLAIAEAADRLEKQQKRIKRLEEALDKTSKAACKHIKQLESEVYALRLYGNKDCTAMADQALKEDKP